MYDASLSANLARLIERAPRDSDLRFHGVELLAAQSSRKRWQDAAPPHDCRGTHRGRNVAHRATRSSARARSDRRPGRADEGPRGRGVLRELADTPVPRHRPPRGRRRRRLERDGRSGLRAHGRSGALHRHPSSSPARPARLALVVEVHHDPKWLEGAAAPRDRTARDRGSFRDRDSRASHARADASCGRTGRPRLGARAPEPAWSPRGHRSRGAGRRSPRAPGNRSEPGTWPDLGHDFAHDRLAAGWPAPAVVRPDLGSTPVERARANGARAASGAVACAVLGAPAAAPRSGRPLNHVADEVSLPTGRDSAADGRSVGSRSRPTRSSASPITTACWSR